MKFNSEYVEKIGEIWRPINDFENLYSISNLGRIRAEESVAMANLRLHKPVKTIKSIFNGATGYCFVCLHRDGTTTQKYVHRLVAIAFIDNPQNKKYVNHKNGIKADNKVENLEWVTFSENIKHAFANNLVTQKGENNARAILTEKDVSKIKLLLKSHTADEVFKILKWPKYKRSSIYNIKHGRIWKDVI